MKNYAQICLDLDHVIFLDFGTFDLCHLGTVQIDCGKIFSTSPSKLYYPLFSYVTHHRKAFFSSWDYGSADFSSL